jgi:hypothetical protein
VGTRPICTDALPRCLDSGNVCRFLGPGGTTVEQCCADSSTSTNTPCPPGGIGTVCP